MILDEESIVALQRSILAGGKNTEADWGMSLISHISFTR